MSFYAQVAALWLFVVNLMVFAYVAGVRRGR